jgi:hypothetical protein
MVNGEPETVTLQGLLVSAYNARLQAGGKAPGQPKSAQKQRATAAQKRPSSGRRWLKGRGRTGRGRGRGRTSKAAAAAPKQENPDQATQAQQPQQPPQKPGGKPSAVQPAPKRMRRPAAAAPAALAAPQQPQAEGEPSGAAGVAWGVKGRSCQPEPPGWL